MSEKTFESSKSASAAIEMVEKTMGDFLSTADVKRAFGKPIEKHDVTVIPAAEVVTVAGFGGGYGSAGSSPQVNETDNEEGLPIEIDIDLTDKPVEAVGGGGGGGGNTYSRPIAVIVISDDGVYVEPIIDPTKIVIAFFTACGFIATTLIKMRKGKIG